MICESYSNRMCGKLDTVNKIYAKLMYEKVDEIPTFSISRQSCI